MFLDFYIRILFVTTLTVLSLTWLTFFLVKMLSSYKDTGQVTKTKKKKISIQSSEDDIPEFAINKKPLKIETSFGGGRIGEVFDGGSSE
jgi:hypothetical protein